MSSGEGAGGQAYTMLMQQFFQAADQVSDDEAVDRVRQFLQQAPPDVAEDASRQMFEQLPPDARRQLAAQFHSANDDPNTPFDGFEYDDDDQAAEPANLSRMTLRAGGQDPALLGGLFGGSGDSSPLGGTLGKMAMAALAAYLAQRLLSGNQQAGAGQAPGADPLGGLLGGAGGGMPAGAGGLGDILGGLLGGAQGQGGAVPGAQGNLGDILGGLLGGAQGQGGAVPGAQGNLGDLLGGLLGGIGGLPQQGGQAPRRSPGLSTPND